MSWDRDDRRKAKRQSAHRKVMDKLARGVAYSFLSKEEQFNVTTVEAKAWSRPKPTTVAPTTKGFADAAPQS